MDSFRGGFRSARVLVIGLVTVLVVIGLALMVMLLSNPQAARQAQQVNALANSSDFAWTATGRVHRESWISLGDR